MQQEINLRTFVSHTLLPCTGKLEKEDLVVLISFYEIKRGNTFMTSSLHQNQVMTRLRPYFLSTILKITAATREYSHPRYQVELQITVESE